MLASLDKKISTKGRAVQRALNTGAMQLADALKQAVKLNWSRGRRYKRRGVVHYASRAGAYPNSDTGFLGKSIQVSSKRRQGSSFVVVGARYAKALEFGSRRRNLKPRPFVRPVSKQEGPAIRKRILEAMRNA